MNISRPQPTHLKDGLLLLIILVLAFFMASIPHLQYRYPLHIDEWMHYGQAESLMQAGRIDYPNPFEAGENYSPDIEVGFHLFLGELQLITGISWLSLFRFLPGIVLALVAFQTYALGRDLGFGLEAAFLVILIPTTARFLGPAFLVPVALGLTFIPLTLFVLRRLMFDIRGPMILLLLLLSLLFIHPPTFAVVSTMALVHLAFSLIGEKSKGRFRQSVLALVFLLALYILMLFWAPSFVHFVAKEAADAELHLQLLPIQGAVPKFGYIPTALFVLGAGILAFRGKREDRALLLSTVGLLLFQQLYPRFYIGPDIVYERGWLYIFVLMALMGGLTLTEIKTLIRSALNYKAALASCASYITIGILVVLAFTMSLRSHLSEPYYHVVDDTIYQDFRWIREYVPPHYKIGVLDTGVAWAFAAVSGKLAYTAEVAPNFHAKGRSAQEFLADNASDTAWLRERGISIVYSSRVIENTQLIKVNHNLYLVLEKKTGS